jgi:hypothetical protein
MEPRGWKDNLKLRRLTRSQHLSVGDYSANVCEIVRSITALRREGRDTALFPFRKINHHGMSKSFALLRTTRIKERLKR